ncbi:hypothetical protein [Leucobacter aridicollis]|uniref:HXXEE domain-containing protein n=1 Tax=Leucobacter aridicollis TaxID=283878 RepID=A0A852RCB5_9MICO|nr:hypothetical protein [Leucobacter aridicollis]MBL3681929.1 hypothetical protein [Leucobacter aridicollis]NYD27026.1 hypothetical protein [Leucobacter aridicollis]
MKVPRRAENVRGPLALFATWALHDVEEALAFPATCDTHIAASLAQRRYTAGAATAVPIMLPGAVAARRELKGAGEPLRSPDYARGTAILLPAALLSQALARILPLR